MQSQNDIVSAIECLPDLKRKQLLTLLCSTFIKFPRCQCGRKLAWLYCHTENCNKFGIGCTYCTQLSTRFGANLIPCCECETFYCSTCSKQKLLYVHTNWSFASNTSVPICLECRAENSGLLSE